jgi:hypothetical protein
VALNFKTLVTYVAVASIAGSSSTFALKNSDFVSAAQTFISSTQGSIASSLQLILQPIIEKMAQGKK